MSRGDSRERRGVTLIELLVVLVLLGLMAAVSSLSIPASNRQSDDAQSRMALLAWRLRLARGEALRSGHSVTVQLTDTHGVVVATALPDGSVIVDSLTGGLLAWDMLSGKPQTFDKHRSVVHAPE